MEMEQRVERLEHEVNALKIEIQKTLLEIQAALPDKKSPPVQWQKKAWVLALLNILMAVTLFTNIYLYVATDAPFAINPLWTSWLRALWITVAFVWLLLQMYPLAMLLEQEERQWQGVVWRNAIHYFGAHPGLMLGLTLAVLVVALVNAVLPVMWFVVGLALLVAVAGVAVSQMRELYRERANMHAKGK